MALPPAQGKILGLYWEENVGSPDPPLDLESFITCSIHRNLALVMEMVASKTGKAPVLTVFPFQ